MHRAHNSRSAKFPGVLLADLIPWTWVSPCKPSARSRGRILQLQPTCTTTGTSNMLQPRKTRSDLTNHRSALKLLHKWLIRKSSLRLSSKQTVNDPTAIQVLKLYVILLTSIPAVALWFLVPQSNIVFNSHERISRAP
jgi:hypothetical protein